MIVLDFQCGLVRGDIRGDIFPPDYYLPVLIEMEFRSLETLLPALVNQVDCASSFCTLLMNILIAAIISAGVGFVVGSILALPNGPLFFHLRA